jgi:hypothetical protein
MALQVIAGEWTVDSCFDIGIFTRFLLVGALWMIRFQLL